MMDSRIGLDYIVENREYISKLGSALDTHNIVVKKQVFELLSALCAYNAEGYARAIETLEFYKKLKHERYRFKIIVNELEKTPNVEYQVALLAFINCVIISAISLQERIRIRNELIGLKVLPLLNNLRKVARSVGDIIVQLDVFDEQRECDEAQSLQGPSGINLNSHLDVFYAILRQVADTPQEVPFLSILQHLLQIDPKEPVSDVIWDTTEKLVHRATLLENHEDSVRLLRTSTAQKFTCSHCRADANSPSRRTSGVATSVNANNPLSPSVLSSSMSSNSGVTVSQPPPPPPPPLPVGAIAHTIMPPPPPPPLVNGGITIMSSIPPPPLIPNAPPAPPAPPAANHLNPTKKHLTRSVSPEPSPPNQSNILLPQQDTPAPKAKMKTINWGKIPPSKVIGKQNIWTIVANSHQDSRAADIDWTEMEGLFCLQSSSAQGSPKLGRDSSSSSGYDTLDRKSKKENTEITLLDGKRSLNVNIFLKQFRSSNEDIIQLIRNGAHNEIGAEKLRGLLKILPEVDELDMLKSFNGDKNRLGNAEKFLLQLMEVPNYKLRIESMLLKEEFAANVSYLDPCINAMIYAGDDLMNNKMLQDVLYMVVVAGNFLNSGGYAGNAAGVKLTSLQKLTDIRANKPGMNLIHFVAMQAEKRNPELLKFTTQLSAVENASKTTSEQINNEINTLDSRIRKIKKQIEQPATNEDIKKQMVEFLQSAERDVCVLQAGMKEVERMRLKLSEFFCEDPVSFKIEECFKIFQSFCDKFKQAIKENEKRQQLEEQANLRRKQREEQIARRAKQINLCGTPGSDCENQFLLDPLFDPRASPALSRRRMGSFNSGVDFNSISRTETNDGLSPDITPNGSLRRRKSKVLAEEDDLMEFLRNSSSGQEHISRDRKAYGSLDRSWARRARSGSASRKRPELLNIDFGADRERASSPAPFTQQDRQSPTASNKEEASPINVQSVNEETKPRISREWRQKIETWLQSNENDEKQNEEYKRKRRLIHSSRRSLENDTESERKLHTLPEERIVPTPTSGNHNHHTNNNTDRYKRVYADWKPSNALEHTDVVGTIQAIADADNARQKSQQSTNIQNESLNKSNSELAEYRRQRSSESAEKYTTPLHSIAEEDKRKSYIQKLSENEFTDRLHIYMRKPSYKEERGGQNSGEQNEMKKSNTKMTAPPVIDIVKSPTPPLHNTLPTKANSNTKANRDNSFATVPLSKSCNNSFELKQSKADEYASSSHNEKYSHKEIDADNVETPPVTRRVVAKPHTTIVTITGTKKDANSTNQIDNESSNDHNNIVDTENPGYFDRYSSTRRTRRYKRPMDYSSGNEELTTPKESKELSNTAQQMTDVKESSVLLINKECTEKLTESPSKLPAEQIVIRSPLSEKTITKLEKVGRHISSINQEDVQEAIRNLKSPTGTPERIWSPPRDVVTHTVPSPLTSVEPSISIPSPPSISANIAESTAPLVPTTIKVSNHELNDEGFEETQSLVSDTPSHGKESANSSSNEVGTEMSTHTKNLNIQKLHAVTNKHLTPSDRLANRLQMSKLRSTLTQKTHNSGGYNTKKRNLSSSSAHTDSSKMNAQRLAQQASNSSTATHMNNYANGVMQRATSIRKSASNGSSVNSSPSHGSSASRRDVERSSSRNSLRSSRSSINSAVSTNTVRRMPLVLGKQSSSPVPIDSVSNKRPLVAQNTSHVRHGGSALRSAVMSASRSSSSGSSVGPNLMVARKTSAGNNRQNTGSSSLGSTSFKENQTQVSNPPTRANSARNAVLVKVSLSQPAQSAHNSQRNRFRSAANNRTVSGFMRPTASSATKRNK